MASLVVTPQLRGDVVVLEVQGALDLETVDRFRDIASSSLADERCSRIAIDATGLDFVDSTGIGGLVDVANAAESAGKTVQLVNATAQVARILELVGLAHLTA